MPDILILGGGVIGLSIAYELAGSGMRVRLVDRGAAGARNVLDGRRNFPSVQFPHAPAPEQWLAGFSNQLHVEWAAKFC